MKHVSFGCSVVLGGWLLCALVIALGLLYRFDLPLAATSGVAVGAGLLGWIAAALVFSAVVTLRERFAVRAALDGEPPRDGPRAVAIGTVQSQGDPLRAPLSGEECVAYAYKVIHTDGRPGRQRRIINAYEGRALAPCTIASGAGYFRLFTVPELDPDTASSTGLTKDVAKRYVDATTFVPADRGPVQELHARWDDDDGRYRCDVARMPPEDFHWARATLQQQVLHPGAQVCVIGYFSSARGGFVPSPVWRKATWVYACSGAQLMAALVRSALWRVVWAAGVAGLAAGMLWVFVADHQPV